MPSAEKLAAMSDEELIDGAQAVEFTAAWIQEASRRLARRRWTVLVDVRPLIVSGLAALAVLAVDRIKRRSDA
jgi:hypothetical protein